MTTKRLISLALTALAVPLQLIAARDDKIRALVEATIDRDGPGVAILVSRNGVPLHLAGYGLADVKAETPITADSLFDLASVSKQMTGVAIQIISRRSQELAWSNGRYDNGNPIQDEDGDGYGCGWVIEKNHRVSHSGSWSGTATYLLLDLEKGWTVAVLSNDEKTAVSDLAEEILALLLADS